jgi:hypothetical protein
LALEATKILESDKRPGELRLQYRDKNKVSYYSTFLLSFLTSFRKWQKLDLKFTLFAPCDIDHIPFHAVQCSFFRLDALNFLKLHNPLRNIQHKGSQYRISTD